MSNIVSAQAEIPCSGLRIARDLPIVSTRAMWEARSREEWMSEKTFFEMSRPFMTFGEIVDARERSRDPVNSRKLQNWDAGTDKLGMLLNIATAFL